MKSLTAAQRNGVGQLFAQYCAVSSLWPDDGPFPLLREMAMGRAPTTLTPQHQLLLRVAFDVYDGSGGGVSVAVVADGLAGHHDLLGALTQFLLGMLDPEDGIAAALKVHGIEVDEMTDAERVTQLARVGNLQ